VVAALEKSKIATRLLFGGNLTKQPAYRDAPYRVGAPLTQTDLIMENTFWIGVYPGLSPAMIDHVASAFRSIRKSAFHLAS
jgi:dTDP-4-amino-4,6-dideoxygalactose transaminase